METFVKWLFGEDKKERLKTYCMFPEPLCSKPWFESRFLTNILNIIDNEEGTIEEKHVKYDSILLNEKVKEVERSLISQKRFEHYLGEERDTELKLEKVLKDKGYRVYKNSKRYRVEGIGRLIETFVLIVEFMD